MRPYNQRKPYLKFCECDTARFVKVRVIFDYIYIYIYIYLNSVDMKKMREFKILHGKL